MKLRSLVRISPPLVWTCQQKKKKKNVIIHKPASCEKPKLPHLEIVTPFPAKTSHELKL
jgi:hypothetical protein